MIRPLKLRERERIDIKGVLILTIIIYRSKDVNNILSLFYYVKHYVKYLTLNVKGVVSVE